MSTPHPARPKWLPLPAHRETVCLSTYSESSTSLRSAGGEHSTFAPFSESTCADGLGVRGAAAALTAQARLASSQRVASQRLALTARRTLHCSFSELLDIRRAR